MSRIVWLIARYVNPKNGHLDVDKQTNQRAPPSTSCKACCPLPNPAVKWEMSRSFWFYHYMDVSCVTPTCAWLVAFNTGAVYIAFVPRGSQFGANTMPTQSLLSAHGQRILAGLFLCPPASLQTPPPSLNCCFSQKDSWGGWSHNADGGISSASGYLWLRGLTRLQAEVV